MKNAGALRTRIGNIWCLSAIIAAIVVGVGTASAQRFERTFGTVCDDRGLGGVQQVTEGGYVAAGSTRSVQTGCVQQDAYVVRTNHDGTLKWSRTYRLGTIDGANDIQEVLTAVGTHDGFILAGTTRDPVGCGFVNQDIFLLRLDRCGNVTWALSIDNGMGGYEEAHDVVVAANGDFIVAGNALNNGDGFLMRVSPAGVLLWSKRYNTGSSDYFYAVDEAANGDIIAAGTTNGTPSGTFDAWIVRVSSAGVFVAAPHNAVTYGGTSSNESLRSVQELTAGTKAGDIVAVGRTDYGHPGNPDVLLVETGPNPCQNLLARSYGDNGVRADEGYCVREILPHTGAGASSIIVSGYLTPPAGSGFGGQDIFLKKFVTGTLAQAAGASGAVYGSAFPDIGWSVSPAQKVGTCATSGFVVAGPADGTLTDPSQLTIVKTNAALSSGCEIVYSATNATPGFGSNCSTPAVVIAGTACTPAHESTCPTWFQKKCYTADGITDCLIVTCPECGAEGAGGAEISYRGR